MKRFLLFSLAISGVFVLAGTLVAGDGGGAHLGAAFELEDVTPAAAILDDPEAWAGKRVRVEGEVADVCQKKGCWLEIAVTATASLRVKVEDGVIVIPQEAKGRWAIIEGEVTVQEISREEWEGWLGHLAEEQGKEFDPAAIDEGPYRLIQVQGSGLEIAADTGP